MMIQIYFFQTIEPTFLYCKLLSKFVICMYKSIFEWVVSELKTWIIVLKNGNTKI